MAADPHVVQIEGRAYSVGRLNAIEQLHVSRKIVPLMAPIANIMRRQGGKPSGFDAFDAASEVLAAMPAADVEYVIQLCLSKCRRDVGGTWIPVCAPGAELRLAFDDMDMPEMLKIVIAVVERNLGNFFSAPLSTPESAGGVPAPASA